MSSVPLALFRYVGPGSEVFVDWHWQPVPGEERELPEDVSHPHLELVERPADAPAPERKPRKENA